MWKRDEYYSFHYLSYDNSTFVVVFYWNDKLVQTESSNISLEWQNLIRLTLLGKTTNSTLLTEHNRTQHSSFTNE